MCEPSLEAAPLLIGQPRLRRLQAIRLVVDPEISLDTPRPATTDAELLDLDLAWRLVRGVTSNAIVLVRDRRLIGIGSGQTSRVDAARGAVEKARAYAGDEALRAAACASDAFSPSRMPSRPVLRSE